MALNRPRDPLVFLNFLVDLLGSRLLPSMSVELPAGVAALQLLPSMSVELTADVAAWVLRYQLPAGGLVSAGSNILVALLCFLGCFFGSFLGCFLGCTSSSVLRGSAAGFRLLFRLRSRNSNHSRREWAEKCIKNCCTVSIIVI